MEEKVDKAKENFAHYYVSLVCTWLRTIHRLTYMCTWNCNFLHNMRKVFFKKEKKNVEHMRLLCSFTRLLLVLRRVQNSEKKAFSMNDIADLSRSFPIYRHLQKFDRYKILVRLILHFTISTMPLLCTLYFTVPVHGNWYDWENIEGIIFLSAFSGVHCIAIIETIKHWNVNVSYMNSTHKFILRICMKSTKKLCN